MLIVSAGAANGLRDSFGHYVTANGKLIQESSQLCRQVPRGVEGASLFKEQDHRT